MKITWLFRFFLLGSLLLLNCGCGRNSGNSSGAGNPPPPTTTEILYAADTTNAIFAFAVDQTSGALSPTASVTPGGLSSTNSVLALTPTGSFLYAVNDDTAGINCYATDKSGSLSLTSGSPYPILPAVQPPWSGVLALVADPKGRFLYVGTNAGLGGVASFSIDSNTGALTGTGGPFAPNFGGFPVGIAINPAGTFLYATDQVGHLWAFSIDAQAGTLSAITGSPFTVPGQGYGIQVDPSGHFVYVAMSNVNSIAAFSIDSASGALTSVPGSPFATSLQFAPYKLAIHPTGKFLYAINQGVNNTVGALAINSTTGGLTPISGSPFAITPNTEGDLIVDPSGKFLYMTAGGFAPPNAFVMFNINPSTGVLTPNLQSPITGTEEPFGLAVAQFQ